MEKCRSYEGGAGVREWNGLRPAGKAVNDCEQMAVTCRRWERAYEVDVDVLKVFLWRCEPLERSLHMDLDLGSQGMRRPICLRQMRLTTRQNGFLLASLLP